MVSLGLIVVLLLNIFVSSEARDTNVVTEPKTILQKGHSGRLSCKVEEGHKVQAVFWNKGIDLISAENLVFLMFHNGEWIRGGPPTKYGPYNITDDYTLIIQDVKTTDQGRYDCEVALIDDYLYKDSTYVIVVAPPTEPFPAVEGCPGVNDGDGDYCTIVTASAVIKVTCAIQNYFPNATLQFRQVSNSLSPSERREWENDDGTFSQTVTVEVAPSDVPYKCVASDIPGYSHEREVSKLIYIKSDKKTTTTTTNTMSTQHNRNTSHTYVLLLTTLVVLLCILCGVLYMRQRIRNRITGHRRGEEMSSVYVNAGSNEEQLLINDETDYVRKLVKQLTSRHVRRIDNVIHSRAVFYSPTDVIIVDNNDVIFDALRMLQEWVNEQREEGFSEDYVRSRLKEAETLALGKDPNDYNWMCDEDLRYLADLLPASFMNRLSDKLKLAQYSSVGSYKALCEWRDYSEFNSNEDRRKMLYSAIRELRFTTAVLLESELRHVCDKVSTDHHNQIREQLGIKPKTTTKYGGNLLEELMEWRLWDHLNKKGWKPRQQLYAFLSDMDYHGVLSPIKERYISIVDLIELATELYMEDIRPFARALGIEDTTLLTYQQPFKHTHLEKGTFLLMLKLREITESPNTTERTSIGQQIKETGYFKVARKNRLGLLTYPTAASSKNNIQKILHNINDEEFNRLFENVCDRDRTKFDGTQITDASSEQAREKMVENLLRWTTQLEQSRSYDDLQIEHRDFIDALVRAGLLELAKEIQLIEEQYIARRDAKVACS